MGGWKPGGSSSRRRRRAAAGHAVNNCGQQGRWSLHQLQPTNKHSTQAEGGGRCLWAAHQ